MCGIAGWIDRNRDIRQEEKTAWAMARTLNNRGPDEGGFFCRENVWLVHRRLSVIDPDNGKQPMSLEWGGTTYTLVYNGELYNTGELRSRLKELGHRFLEQSDTEVLLHAFAQWGVDCLPRLNGIYAFAVWNEREQSLVLARDRMGVKPLFFYCLEKGLVFGSAIKTLLAHPAVKPEVDGEGLRELFYLSPGRTPGKGVIRGVEELLPGEYAVLGREGLRRRLYWQLEAREHPHDLQETVTHTRELVLDAIGRQLVSDVPLCCFLSGGLDSSLISAVAAEQYREKGQRLTTWSVDYDDNQKYFKASAFQPNSDKAYIDLMSRRLGTEHREVVLGNRELAQALGAAATARDLPGMADVDSSLLLFCQKIRESFTVGVSGECADEIFGGYPWFHRPELMDGKEFPWARSTAVRSSVLRPGVITDGGEYAAQRCRDTVSQAPLLPGESLENRRIRQMTVLNLQWFMQTLLDRKDRMSMECGLEVRVPFCDHRIVEYAYNMPWELKAWQGREKGILRKAVEDLLPYDIVWRKKSPYPKTHNPIFLEEVTRLVKQVEAQKDSPLQELVDWSGVEAIIRDPDSLPGNWYGQLMAGPQVLAWLVQLDAWVKELGIRFV